MVKRIKVDLPIGWAWTSLDCISQILNGCGFPKKIQGKIEGKYPFFKVGDISTNIKSGLNHLELCKNYIDDEDLNLLKGKLLPKNTIVFAKIGEALKLNRRGILKAPSLVDNNVIGVKTFDYLANTLFVFYFLRTIKLETFSRATTVPSVRKSDIEGIQFPLPPLPEQHRIVAKIEELFSQLDSGISSLKKAQAQLKIYRQAVLKYAFEGKLTEEWRKQHQPDPAEKLLEQIRLERERHHQQQLEEWKAACEQAKSEGKKKPVKPRKPKELPPLTEDELGELPALPEGWCWVKSGELFSFVTSGSRGWAKYYSNHGATFIRIANLNFDSLNLDLHKDKIQHVSPPKGTEGVRTKIQQGDLLFSITGYLGMFAIAPKINDAYINQHIALARPVSGYNIEYVGYYCIAKTGGYFYLNKLKKGATKAGLTLDDIKTFPIPISPIMEQHAIVQEIESRLSVCDKLEQTIETNLRKSDALRQSILKKAFEGKLVPQNPDDEPAEKLLERIQLEKAELDAKNKAAKAKKKKKRR